MEDKEKIWIYHTSIHQKMENSLSGIYISFLATYQKIVEVYKIDYYSNSSDRYQIKADMKEVEGSAMSITIFLGQTCMLLLSKAMEDLLIDIEERFDRKINIWKEANDYRHGDRLLEIRALANVIKHNRNRIESKSSQSASYLVNKAEYTDG